MPEIPAENPSQETPEAQRIRQLESQLAESNRRQEEITTKLADATEKISQLVSEVSQLNIQVIELKTAKTIAENLSMTDTLTELPNRRFVETTLTQELALVGRSSAQDLGVLVIDLDNFKGVNDEYGHPQGDEVLKGIAKEIGSEIRESDVFGRTGGDEFTILLHLNPDDGDDIVDLAKRFVAAANRVNRSNTPGQFIPQGVSIGFARVRRLNEVNSEIVIKAADKLAYNAKHKGKNQVSYSVIDESGNTEIKIDN